MKVEKLLRYDFIGASGFDPFRHHRLVGNEQERGGWVLVFEAGDEERGGLHVDAHTTDAREILLKGIIVFPDPAICGVNSTGPIILIVVPNRGGDGFLQREGRQRRYFRRKIIVRRAIASNSRN